MSSTEKNLLNRVRACLDEAGILPGESLCSAYSGGPDSTALLLILEHLQREYEYVLKAVYIEHGIRDGNERASELRHVVMSASRLNIPLYTQCLPPGLLEREAAVYGGMEGAARRWRYGFFEKIRQVTGSRFTVLAHTGDDQVETLLMRIFQGSGPEGLRGMKSVEGFLLRPLLRASKEELLEFLESREWGFSRDSTNDSHEYLRNAVRHTILPAVKKVFPSLDRSLDVFSEKMDITMEALASREYTVPKETGSGEASCDHERFFQMSLYYRMRTIYQLYNRWYPEDGRRLPHAFLRELCSRPSRDRKHLYGTGHGLQMEKRGSRLFWKRVVVPFRKKSYLSVVQSGIFKIGNSLRYRVFSEDPTHRGGGIAGEGSIEIVTADDYLPCVVRSERTGDSILLARGCKKVRSLVKDSGGFGDEERDCAVLEDRRGILAVVLFGRELRLIIGSLAEQDIRDGIIYRFDFSRGGP